ncbi:28S ribosomal protein S27, mitochondrial [Arapaima gigas]
MAATVLQRCVWMTKGFAKFAAHRFTATRCLLSASYTDPKIWEERELDSQNLAELAALMDRTYERKLPVSSLTISRFVDNITSREEIEQAEYYLYKFRHSPNCWYLRDWTIHSWFRHCLKYNRRDRAMYTLKNKVQFGIFPDDFTFNLLLDSFLKDKDYKGAFSVVEEIMLQEAFDLPSTRILSLHALTSYLATKPELTWQEERDLGASLLTAGMKQGNSLGVSTQLLGCSLLGKVEMLKGIQAVFRGAPLMWTPGYLNRALVVMETACAPEQHVKISQEALDYLNRLLQELSVSLPAESEGESKTEEVVDEEDELERTKIPEYTSRFKDLSSQLQALGRVDTHDLQALASAVVQEELGAAEAADLVQYQERLQQWEQERRALVQREEEQREKLQQQREARAAEKSKESAWRARHR